MIVTRTPFRITLGGGGTDLLSYYSKYGGFIFAAGINKYMYINVNRPVVDELVRVKYTKSETVSHRDELEHELARHSMALMGIEKALEISSMADLPAGTGLGSSSCYTVGLLNALHTLKRQYVSLEDLAEKACRVEIEMAGKPIGKQDQYMAAFGGLTVLDISIDGKVSVRSAKVSEDTLEELNKNMMMFYTGVSRSADIILEEQSAGVKEDKKNVVENMHYIKELGYKILEAAETGNLSDIGLLFDKHWRYKKQISNKMSNSQFDKIYDLAKASGALGGKISGAGGGGFFLFYVEKNHPQFAKKMNELGLKQMKYRFDFEGTKVVANMWERTSLA